MPASIADLAVIVRQGTGDDWTDLILALCAVALLLVAGIAAALMRRGGPRHPTVRHH